jgi:hypothetical protein
MKFFYAQSVAWALGLAWFVNVAQAQQYQPSLLPIPSAPPAYQVQGYQPQGYQPQDYQAQAYQSYPSQPVAYRNDLWDDKAAQPEAVSPSDSPSILPAPPLAQPDHSVLNGDFRKATSGNWAGSSVVADDGDCGAPCCTPCQNYWYGYAGGLIMTRVQHNHFLITRDVNDIRLLCSCQLDMGWTGGVEATIGRTFNCGCNAIQFTYWGIYPCDMDTTAYASTLGANLNAGIDFTGAIYNGNPVTDITMDGAMQQGIARQSYHNFEGNLLGQCWGNGFIGGGMESCQRGLCDLGHCGPKCGGNCGPRWGCGWMMGFRYFQFDNGFSFNADGADEVWNDDVDELCFHVNLKNRLWGFQVGGGWNWSVCNCLQLYGLAKAGIYNNSISQHMSLHGAGGTGTFGDGTDIDIRNSVNRLALIGQLDLGIRYNVTRHFGVTAGYRIMGASGVALYEHNIPTDFTDSYYAAKIESDGSLLLHGAYIGGEVRF